MVAATSIAATIDASGPVMRVNNPCRAPRPA